MEEINDILEGLSPEEIAALEGLDMTLHSGRAISLPEEHSVVAAPVSGATQTSPEASSVGPSGAASVVSSDASLEATSGASSDTSSFAPSYTSSEISTAYISLYSDATFSAVSVREQIRLLREEMREESITPARIADILEAILDEAGQSSGGLSEEEKSDIDQRIADAEKLARDASSKADSASAKADSALQKAGTAQQTADSATAKAEAAQQTADSASAKAVAAQQTADSATAKAEASQQTADSATAKAEAAQQTADSAVSECNRIANILSPLTDIWIGDSDALAALPEIKDTVLYFVREKPD